MENIEYYTSIKQCNPSIADSRGDLRDVTEILLELNKLYLGMNTEAMSDHTLWLCGKKEMLSEVIDYLQRVL